MKCINVSGTCASTAIAFATADAMIKSGYIKTALVVGADNSPSGFFYQAPSILDTDLTTNYPHKVIGITNPSYWAM
jgi:3-oxoacyl-[acyl-carrier-protein] synthase III